LLLLQGEAVPIAAAVSLGNPFDLVVSNEHINKVGHSIADLSLVCFIAALLCMMIAATALPRYTAYRTTRKSQHDMMPA
jgi:hypothetical protein